MNTPPDSMCIFSEEIKKIRTEMKRPNADNVDLMVTIPRREYAENVAII